MGISRLVEELEEALDHARGDDGPRLAVEVLEQVPTRRLGQRREVLDRAEADEVVGPHGAEGGEDAVQEPPLGVEKQERLLAPAWRKGGGTSDSGHRARGDAAGGAAWAESGGEGGKE